MYLVHRKNFYNVVIKRQPNLKNREKKDNRHFPKKKRDIQIAK